MKIVIIGFSLAGYTASRYILMNAPKTEMEIFDEDNYPYYPRPSLYEVLSGESPLDKILLHPAKWYEDRGIKLHLGVSVKSIKVEDKEIILGSGESVSYDKLLLANGARPSIPPLKGTDKKGVFSIRTIDDVLSIKEYVKGKKDAIVIGGGLLGLEASESLGRLGLRTTVLEFAPWLLPRQIDTEGSDVLINEFEKRGVKTRCGTQTEEITGDDKVTGVKVKGGYTIPAQLVVFATGIRSNIELPKEAGINVNKGVVVDDHLRTNIEDIYAAGDVAEHKGRVYGIIPATTEQAQTAAANMIGKETVYNGTVASNTLKIEDIDLTSIGIVNPEGNEYEQIRYADADKCTYKKIVLKDGKIVGAVLIGDRKIVKPMTDIISKGINVEDVKQEILKEDFDFNQFIAKNSPKKT
jgi:nitrite reductase (NADH) large subunit